MPNISNPTRRIYWFKALQGSKSTHEGCCYLMLPYEAASRVFLRAHPTCCLEFTIACISTFHNTIVLITLTNICSRLLYELDTSLSIICQRYQYLIALPGRPAARRRLMLILPPILIMLLFSICRKGSIGK